MYLYLFSQIIFLSGIIKVESLFCINCTYYKRVRINNDYSVISELCGAYVKPLDEDNTFISELRNEYEDDYWSCMEARISEDMCGVNGLRYTPNYVTELNKLQHIIHKLDNLILINKILDGIEERREQTEI